MKKFLALILACTMLLTLTACKKAAPVEHTLSEVERTAHESLEAINAATGGKIGRPTCVTLADEAFEVVTADGVEVAQYVFTASDTSCGIRFSADKTANISELDIAAEDLMTDLEDDDDYEIAQLSDLFAARWETADGQYVLIAVTTDRDYFDALLQDCKSLTMP